MLIAQITDMHITAVGAPTLKHADTAGNLARTVETINAFAPRPDLVIATGDLVNDGHQDSVEHLRTLLAPLAMPVLLVPGNHDDRAALRAVFPEAGYLPDDGMLNYVIDDYSLRIIVLDTIVPGEPGGLMDEARLDWLRDRLAEAPGRPTLIAMHHPPFDSGIRIMDGMNCKGGDAMADIVATHSNVVRVICGHVHRSIQRAWAGTIATISPATSLQLNLELDPDSDLGWRAEPPAFMLHDWREEDGGRMISHVCQVGGFQQLPV